MGSSLAIQQPLLSRLISRVFFSGVLFGKQMGLAEKVLSIPATEELKANGVAEVLLEHYKEVSKVGSIGTPILDDRWVGGIDPTVDDFDYIIEICRHQPVTNPNVSVTNVFVRLKSNSKKCLYEGADFSISDSGGIGFIANRGSHGRGGSYYWSSVLSSKQVGSIRGLIGRSIL